MNLDSKRNISALFKKYKIKPSRLFGQNFLIDKNVIKKIIKTANIKVNDAILEIGPGVGVLTQELAKKAEKIIAVEKDFKMVEILKERTKYFKNIGIIQGDILKILDNRLPHSYKIVSNLPFYISSPVIRKFLESKKPPSEIVLVIQKEVAQRICEKPPKMNLLAVSVQFYAKPKIISYISKKSFWPQPTVDGAILRIFLKNKINKNPIFSQKLFKIVKIGFSHPRKKLVNNLLRGLKSKEKQIQYLFTKNGINLNQRAENLTIDEWMKITKKIFNSP